MHLITEQSEAETLLQEVYQILQDSNDLNSSRNDLEKRLKKAIDLTWRDSNSFESYFEEFNRVIESMIQLNFDERLLESDDPNSLLNFVAKGINSANERLKAQYLDKDTLPEILTSLKVENRIVIISKDKATISQIASNFDGVDTKTNPLIEAPVSRIVKKEILKLLLASGDSSYSYSGQLSKTVFPEIKDRKVNFSIANGKYLTITLTFYPDSIIEENRERTLKLLYSLKTHFENHPQAIKTLSGYFYNREIRSLCHDLKDYFDSKDFRLME
ncbi:MAG: hypothetical protein ACI837_001641 [Crocinitomicaceae bacterium]|jgi:hypothetical protein